jgi:hypothetical protein
MKRISLSEFSLLLRGNPGLIIGIDQIVYPGKTSELQQSIRNAIGSSALTLHNVIDDSSEPNAAALALEALKQDVSQWSRNSSLTSLSKVRWSSVLSLSPDLSFEDLLQSEADKRLTRKTICIGYDLQEIPAPHSLSVFKMCGSVARGDFALDSVAYTTRRVLWRFAVQRFSEAVKGNPVICLGVAGQSSVLLDLLSEFLPRRSGSPTVLVFAGDDPCIENAKISQLIGQRSRLVAVDASASEIARQITSSLRQPPTASLPFPEPEKQYLAKLSSFEDLCVAVNQCLQSSIGREEHTVLREILFSPNIPRWEPFCYDLDFKRTVTDDLLAKLRELWSNESVDEAILLIKGSAATGKTTLAKRVAYELASQGATVLWHLASFYSDKETRIRQCFTELSRLIPDKRSPVLYFIDDPFSAGSVTPGFIVSTARKSGVRVFVVATARSSDWGLLEDQSGLMSGYHTDVFTVGDELDAQERSLLPEYLMSLGIETDVAHAKTRLQLNDVAKTSDTLSLLYWLLKETRANIAESVRGEFFRLGDHSGFRRLIVGEKESAGKVLRAAYEMVAIASRYDVPLPLEILVHTLDISYDEWLQVIKGGKAWGILYSETSEDNAEYYRTRNSVVAGIIAETLNGGPQSRSADVRVLCKLISSSHGYDGVVFREFLVRLLVPWSKLRALNYAQGLEVYECAIASLGKPDQLLVHHKGLWVKNVGNLPMEALQVFQEALQTPAFPYSDRTESDENINTSQAATVLDAVKLGRIDWSTGKNQALQFLERARAESNFSPNAVHVAARVSLRILKDSQDHEKGDSYELAANTMTEIEQTKQLMTSPVGRMKYTIKNLEYLSSISESIALELVNPDKLDESASDIFASFGSQAGFVVAALQRLKNAKSSGRERDFRLADDFCAKARRQVEQKGVAVDPRLADVHLLIVYENTVIRRTMTSSNHDIDWERVRLLAEEAIIGANPRLQPMSRFILGVAKSHLNDWLGAENEFSVLRSIYRGDIAAEPRAMLLNPQGGARTVQGVVRRVGGETFLWIEILKKDVRCDRRSRWPRDGETVFAYLRFAFIGPIAFDRIL